MSDYPDHFTIEPEVLFFLPTVNLQGQSLQLTLFVAVVAAFLLRSLGCPSLHLLGLEVRTTRSGNFLVLVPSIEESWENL